MLIIRQYRGDVEGETGAKVRFFVGGDWLWKIGEEQSLRIVVISVRFLDAREIIYFAIIN